MLSSLNETIYQLMTVALGLTQIGSAERARRVYEEHEAIARGDGSKTSHSSPQRVISEPVIAPRILVLWLAPK